MKRQRQWKLLTSHGLVLFYLASHPDATMTEIGHRLDLTGRQVFSLVEDLREADLVETERRWRRNHYNLNPRAHFRHELVADVRLSDFVDLMRQNQWQEPAAGIMLRETLVELP